MLGYPGAGKTAISRQIAELTGAVHLWADHERRSMFTTPTHSKDESDELYAHLDEKTDSLLAEGKSVIFDTSFNHFKDREHLRQIAAKHNAKTTLIWVNTPKAIAKARAVATEHATHNDYPQTMSPDDFKGIAEHLEPPRPEESALRVDGSIITDDTAEDLLQQID